MPATPHSHDVRPPAFAGGRLALRLALGLALALAAAGCSGDPQGRVGGPLTPVGGGGGGTGRPVPAFAQVSAGGSHTCALTENNVAWCWGANGEGQAGRATTGATVRPDTVRSASTSFRTLSAGASHTCALDPNGVAWCWGRNAEGQLGTGTAGGRSTVPVRVAGSRSWLSISAGATHTCAIAQNGAPFCWGGNAQGQLGTGTVSAAVASPVSVAGLPQALAITAGDGFTCALRATGAASCWGRADRLGVAGASSTPTAVEGTATYAGIDAGGRATCAIEPAVLRLGCWGEPAAVGSAGATGTGGSAGTAPRRVALDVDVREVSVGATSACALTATGLARCWGSNAAGQLGTGATVLDTASVLPLPVAGDPVFRAVSVGGAHACAITERLETFCWGSNAAGQLGAAASATPVRAPVRVP